MKSLVLALVLAAVGSAVAQYPRYLEVVRNPRVPDLFYGSTLGPHNETWYFSAAATVTSFIIPSQVSFCGSGPANGTYEETVDLFLYETKLSTSPAQTYLLASGSFNGTANYGQELEIPMRNTTLDSAPQVGAYVNSNNGFSYTLNIVFNKTGIYPWYRTRALSTYSVVSPFSNGAGIAIGLTYFIG
ncbi:uncharacterized protein LOC126336588 [Schistocerca gregaria]|uniref:uncharacterized protein LOC126336588 n=1 Tax=Schistocerca gregaria TaxID=7010 RepID=UPI00211E6A60|nr:uncharacterized protein LOC126336588 [Schistocerca gregaria]